MTTDEYIEHCRNELLDCYRQTKEGKSDVMHRHRTEGLLHAARLLGLVSEDELQAMIEQTHIDVFGETIATRKSRKVEMSTLKETNPDSYFDIPAIERRR